MRREDIHPWISSTEVLAELRKLQGLMNDYDYSLEILHDVDEAGQEIISSIKIRRIPEELRETQITQEISRSRSIFMEDLKSEIKAPKDHRELINARIKYHINPK
jgi:hypothetical protein